MSDQNISCPHRKSDSCLIVYSLLSDFTNDITQDDCKITDEACRVCQSLGIDPESPNHVTASISISTCNRLKLSILRPVMDRMLPHVKRREKPDTRCVLRGIQTRTVPCKPCQSRDGKSGVADVFACPIHRECTLLNTGHTPKIQGCVTCQERQPEYIPIPRAARPPEQVLEAIRQQKMG